MGYITYKPEQLADTPVVIVRGAHGDTLTITRIREFSKGMFDYWQAWSEHWYWLAIDSESQPGIPVPDTVLNALRDIYTAFEKHKVAIPEIDIQHRDITYTFTATPYWYIYPNYQDSDGVYDKRPYLNDMDITPQEVLGAITGIEF